MSNEPDLLDAELVEEGRQPAVEGVDVRSKAPVRPLRAPEAGQVRRDDAAELAGAIQQRPPAVARIRVAVDADNRIRAVALVEHVSTHAGRRQDGHGRTLCSGEVGWSFQAGGDLDLVGLDD